MMSELAERPPMAVLTPNSAISFTSRRASPRMGGMTIRKENCASFSLLLPRRRPVAMVLPERERPGNTARAWAMPMTKACQGEIWSRWRGLAVFE